MSAKAYYSSVHRCWFVPVAAPPLFNEHRAIEPCRLELKDGALLITLLDDKT